MGFLKFIKATWSPKNNRKALMESLNQAQQISNPKVIRISLIILIVLIIAIKYFLP